MYFSVNLICVQLCHFKNLVDVLYEHSYSYIYIASLFTGFVLVVYWLFFLYELDKN